MPKRSAKKQAAPAEWKAVDGASEDAAVLKAVKEVEAFWTHGPIEGPQIVSARMRIRGTKPTRTNTDYEVDIRVEEVLYRAAVKGGGDPKVRCPETGRVWVTQPCVVCGKDDAEEALLLCGTDEEGAAVPGCNRSHHTHCVGLESVPEDDWFCESCEAKRKDEAK